MTTDSADRAEWLKQPEAEARRGRQTTKSGRTAANNRTARPQTGGLFRPHQNTSGDPCLQAGEE